MSVYRYLWVFIAFYGCLWVAMSTYRSSRVFGCLWGFMSLWVSMGTYGCHECLRVLHLNIKIIAHFIILEPQKI